MRYEWVLKFVSHPSIHIEDWQNYSEEDQAKKMDRAEAWRRDYLFSSICFFVAIHTNLASSLCLFFVEMSVWLQFVVSLASLSMFMAALVLHVNQLKSVPLMPPPSEELEAWTEDGPYMISELRYKRILYKIENRFHFKNMEPMSLSYERTKYADRRLDQYEQAIYWFNSWSHNQHGRGQGIDSC